MSQLSSIPEQIKVLSHDVKSHKITIVTQSPPTPSPTQYLIRVSSTGITKGELLWQELDSVSSAVPGFDISGTVLSVPSTSPNPKYTVGSRIYALTSFSRSANAREITVVEESEIALTPKNLSPEDAAAVPMSALTAWEALFTHSQNAFSSSQGNGAQNADKRLLIIGASGAVGLWTVQLAKHFGIGTIVGICGSSNVEFVKSLGCTEVLDYSKTSLTSFITTDKNKRFDIILDCVGGESTAKEAWKAVKPNGSLISIVQPLDSFKPNEGVSEGVQGKFFIVEPNGALLEKVTTLIEEGMCRPIVDGVWAMDEYEKSFARVESGRARGKVVIKIGD